MKKTVHLKGYYVMAKASRKVSICRNSTLRSVMVDQTQLEVELQEVAAMAAPIHQKQAVQFNGQPRFYSSIQYCWILCSVLKFSFKIPC